MEMVSSHCHLVHIVTSSLDDSIGSNFVGVSAYADDLIVPSATALRKLLSVCDGFACEYSVL